MKINSEKFFLTDIYSYDISACHFNILKSLGYDLSNIDKNDKTKRNIQIGKLMGQNKVISNILKETTNNIISEYIKRNELKDNNIILRQYDGFLSNKLLKNRDLYLPLELRNIFTKMIISVDKTKFIALTNKNELIIKGIADLYKKLNEIYRKLLEINYVSKIEIFKGIENIKEYIYQSDDIELFCIPYDDLHYRLFFYEYGEIKINKNSINLIDSNDIQKSKYLEIYLYDFVKGLVMDFI